jgi:hypothetical protein
MEFNDYSIIMMKNLTPELKKELFPDNTVLVGFRGSVAHGMYIPNTDPNSIDDIDLMSVFMAPVEHYIGITKSKETVEKFIGKYDSVSYEFIKFVKLLLKSNPNVLSLLWIKDNQYLKRHKYGQMLIDNRNLFVSKIAYKSFTGYAYGQLKKMEKFNFEGYMGDRRKQLVEKFGYDCYDCKTTEFLTDRGWKSFDDVKSEDKLGTVQPLTGKFKFQKYLSTIDKIYNGKMYVIEPYLSKCIVTPGHNLLVSPARRGPKNNYSNEYIENRSDWKLIPLQEVFDGRRSHYHIRRLVNPTNSIDYKIEDSYLQLAGLFVSDGSVNFRIVKSNKKVVNHIRMTQSKPNNGFYDMIRHLMTIYPIKEYNYEKEDIWVLHGEIAKKIYSDFGHSTAKHLPTWTLSLSVKQIKTLWKSLLLGDGTKKIKYDVYYTSLKQLASNIQAMLTIAGIPCTINGPYIFETAFGISRMYHVNSSNISKNIHTLNSGQILKHNEKAEVKKGYPIKELEVVNRRVVCFEVPNGTLITRNDGKISIQGNCKNASHCIRLLKMSIEFLTTGELNVFRQDAPMLLEIKTGKWSLERVKSEAERLFKLADEAYVRSKIPNQPDYDKVEKIVKDILFDYIKKKKE